MFWTVPLPSSYTSLVRSWVVARVFGSAAMVRSPRRGVVSGDRGIAFCGRGRGSVPTAWLPAAPWPPEAPAPAAARRAAGRAGQPVRGKRVPRRACGATT